MTAAINGIQIKVNLAPQQATEALIFPQPAASVPVLIEALQDGDISFCISSFYPNNRSINDLPEWCAKCTK